MLKNEYCEIEIKQLQQILLEILLVIDEFCKENCISYFLDSGTALGAKRHKGFIPWDDDIDLGMMRADYEKFVSLAIEKLPHGYTLHVYENTPGFPGMFAKVCKEGTLFETEETRDSGFSQGIFVDIFPYDCLSSNLAEKKKQLRKAGFWQKVSYLYCSPHVLVPVDGIFGLLARLFCHVSHFFLRAFCSREGIKEKFDDSKRFKSMPSDEVVVLAYPNGGPYKRNMMVPPRNQSFEGFCMPCPNDIEGYLEVLYGPTWKDLPPVENRKSHKPLRLVVGDN